MVLKLNVMLHSLSCNCINALSNHTNDPEKRQNYPRHNKSYPKERPLCLWCKPWTKTPMKRVDWIITIKAERNAPVAVAIEEEGEQAVITTATSTTTTTTTVEASKAEPDSFSQPLHDLDHDSVPSPSSAAYTLQATSPQSQQQNSQQQQTAHNIPQVDQRKAAPVAQEKSSKPKKKSSFPRWSSSSFSTPKNTAAAGTATGFDPSTAPFPFHPASSKETTSSPISPSPYCPADQPRIRLRNQKRRRRVGAGLITIFCIAAIVILVLC